MKSLLLGAGNDRRRKVSWAGHDDWGDLTTLDIDQGTGCDITHDLDVFPYPLADDSFDEIHAYEVLEHCGSQGDWRFFFDQFAELYRILKPGGFMCATVPMWDSQWAWGDPGHRRVIAPGALTFLNREEYSQVGTTAMTDYRPWLRCDFVTVALKEEADTFGFVLQARK